MNKSNQVIGIDFGTSNSHFCKYLVSVENQKIRVFDFGNNQVGSISSTILYRKSSENNILIGLDATNEWGDSSSTERKDYILRTHFKPDIAINKDAYKSAIDFLTTVKNNLQRKRVDFFPDQQNVIMGIPALADENYKNVLTNIAKEAGYENIKLLPEPIGALIYHLWNKDLSAHQTQGGIIVIDFGGGTCDFSYLQHLNVYQTWGDMFLGGRLFDDLFFQWFLDQNPNILDQLTQEGDEYFLHWFLCKDAKETFSNYMLNDRNQIFSKKLGRYGSISDMSWDEFIRRAKNYKPHPTFIKYLKETNQKQNIITDDSTIDLIAWFKESLISGIKKYEIRPNDIERVILTGGSSKWAFVEEIVCEVLHLKENKLLSSENPKAAISEGLVVYPHLKQKMSTTKKYLSDNLNDFFENEIIIEIDTKIDDVVDSLLKEISNNIFDDKIKNRLLYFRNNGGTINSLKESIQSDIYSFEPKMKQIIKAKMLILQKGLPESILQKTHNWFLRNDIQYTGDKINLYNSGAIPEESIDIDHNNISNFETAIMNVVNVFISSIIGVIIAGLAGGEGLALIAAGPVGWIIGLIIGIAITILAATLGRKKAKVFVQTQYIKSWVTKQILPKWWINKKILKSKRKFEKELKEEFIKILKEPKNDMIKALKNNIQREIDSLSVINQL